MSITGEDPAFWEWARTAGIPSELATHSVTLARGRVALRPMTEADWDTLMLWDNDPEVVYYSDSSDATGITLPALQAQMRSVSKHAFMFIIEVDGKPVGECWLQEMNLACITDAHPGADARRIDLALAKAVWGKGIGSVAIELVVEFAFGREGADFVYGMDIADYNTRSRRAFGRAGFVMAATHLQQSGTAREAYDLVLSRAVWTTAHQAKATNLALG